MPGVWDAKSQASGTVSMKYQMAWLLYQKHKNIVLEKSGMVDNFFQLYHRLKKYSPFLALIKTIFFCQILFWSAEKSDSTWANNTLLEYKCI